MKRTAAAYKIKQNNNSGEYTRPEVAFDRLFGRRVFKPLSVKVEDMNGKAWNLSPDRQFFKEDVMVQIDGPYHRTDKQDRKTEWEDGCLVAQGYRVIQIDSELLVTKKYHPLVVQAVEQFLVSNELTKRLAA